ncbi:hypothetical protein Clacol_002814 [Clathrus columnatus]|uniref:Bromo domain-containing protein n=1 Tax=Clathrus columnatus TaxID=1419009 RepID=A0AAV5A2X0_9AGAM|nr:hypothetical protein Clacol_002814 [Clathrus columnatus]
MVDHFLTDEDGSSLYGHDNRSILSASTSSRVTLNGPRQRPKGPRTSDISRSSLVERPGLPLSPLAKEIPVVQEEVFFIPSPAPSLSLNRDNFSLATSPKPRRSSLTRFSFRRSKLKPNVEDAFIGEDPFGSTPHPSVRQWNAGTHSNQQAKALADDVNVSTQIKKSLSLVTPVSQKNKTDQEALVPLKSKRSFFRRMADKFTRTQSPTHLSAPQPQIALFKDIKEQAFLTYTEYPTTYPSPQLPTPASSVQPSSPVLPSLLVVHPDELSSIYDHDVSVTRNSSFVKSPESVSMQALPVIPVEEKIVNNITYIQSAPSTSPRNVVNTNSFLYPVHSPSTSWQPITPISPSKVTDNHLTMRSLHKPPSNDSIPKFLDISNPNSYSKQQTTSIRSIPITYDPPPPDRQKSTSIRSRQYSPSAGFNSNIQLPRKDNNSVELHRHDIHEDPQTLVNLDKVMFEKELARERERKLIRREEKNRLADHEKQSLENSSPIHDLAMSMSPAKRKSKRQSNISLNNFDGQSTRNRILPSKPNSAPNPSSGLKRGPGFSLSLETNFNVNTSHRLYPDILYTVDHTTGSLSSLPDIHSPGRRSLPTQPLAGSLPRSMNEYPHQEYVENGRDKVSQWLVSTTKTNESNESPITNRDINYERIEEAKRYKGKGKGKAPDRGNYNVENHTRTSLPDADLKLLLSSVSNIRSQDAKAADSFYASLESVLLELRTVTPDSRDAEAFLKPVSRSDYPDYYEIIKQPMDMGTMLKHVKSRKYKTKQEFADDLNLIWKNCFKYNSGPVSDSHRLCMTTRYLSLHEEHVLRGCATRLSRKTEHLLAHVSDRPDNITISGLPTPSAPLSTGSFYEPFPKASKVNGNVNGTLFSGGHMSSSEPVTPQADLTPNTPGPSYLKSPHSASGQSSQSYISFQDQPALVRTPSTMDLFRELDREMVFSLETLSSTDIDVMAASGKGKGRDFLLEKLQRFIDGGSEIAQTHPDETEMLDDSTPGWNLKRKRLISASDHRKRLRLAESAHLSKESSEIGELLDMWWNAVDNDTLLMGGIPSLAQHTAIESQSSRNAKHFLTVEHPHKKNRRKERDRYNKEKSLLTLMNRNIATLFRIRRTHSKFVSLGVNTDPNNQTTSILVEPPSDLEVDKESILHETGWTIKGEIDQCSADDCLRWMIGKILQHAGFQGGISEIQDLERYIKDDIIRYGVRLTELEKKLVGAYREVTSVDEEDMFEGDEEADIFLSGGVVDYLGNAEDFLGLRELGIEAEFGLKSLSIPKRLWKGKGSGEDRTIADRQVSFIYACSTSDKHFDSAHTGLPSLPYPPPPSFIPLEASKVNSQIGLLAKFYQTRFVSLASSTHTLPPSIETSLSVHNALKDASQLSASFSHVLPSLVLPDDPPNPVRCKLGPLGQVVHVNASTTTGKKKGKGKETIGESQAELEATVRKENRKKKPLSDSMEEAIENNIMTAEVNGTGPKKKFKSTGGKKSVNGNSKPTLDVPPAIVASA